jgi:hypothetical protein
VYYLFIRSFCFFTSQSPKGDNMPISIEKSSLVTIPEQIVAGQRYIEVVIRNKKTMELTTVVVDHLYPRNWNGGVHMFCQAREQHEGTRYSEVSFLLADRNIPPNGYNHNSLWHYNSETLKLLESFRDSGQQGIELYIEFLKQYKMHVADESELAMN